MTGLERVRAVFAGKEPDRTPIVPIIHSGLAPMFGVPLGDFFTDARTMAEVIIRGYRDFRYDGVQLSLGVTAEPQAFGAKVEQPADAAPVLKEHLLEDPSRLDCLRGLDPLERGRFPLFREAVGRAVEEIGREAFVVVTLRGPFLMATQLRGVENALVETVQAPQRLAELVDFTTQVSIELGRAFAGSGAHAVVLGEATCSPSFISPGTYRKLVLPAHRRVVAELRRAGWEAVCLHICGNLVPILEDVLSTGVNLLDIDHQLPAGEALEKNRGRAVLRGNLDPSAVFAFGTEEAIDRAVTELKAQVGGRGGRGGWIYGSGCDVSPGTPQENLRRVVSALRAVTVG